MRKSVLLLLLMAFVAIPALQAQNPKDMERRAYEEQWYRFTNKVMPQTTLQRQHFVSNLKAEGDIPEGMVRITLAAGDVWQDGSGYQMLLDADANTFGTIIPETGALTTGGDASASTYAEFEYKIPENADGNTSTTNVVLDDAVSILIPAGVYDWCITNPTPGDRIWIASSNGSIAGRYDNYEFVAGSTYVFTVTLGGSNDRVDLEIIDPTAPVMPTNLTADPTATTAYVAWENDHDQVFNLRYREYNPNLAQTLSWDFETDESIEGWMIYDADGDGYNWSWDTGTNGHNSTYCLSSASYTYGEVLYPDNWLISPEVTLNGELSIWAGPYLSSWPDNFAVYVCVGEVDIDADEPGIKISDDLAPSAWTEYKFDLSEFAGAKGHFIIRHYNCYDQYRLLIDDITLNIPGEEPNEWINVEGIEGLDYTIEGLAPETTYEVQVQAVGEDRRVSEWTNSTLFTTLAAGGLNIPTVNVDVRDDVVVVTAEGDADAIVVLYLVNEDGTMTEIENPTAFTRESTDYYVYVVAVAYNGDYEAETDAIQILIPGKTTGVNEMQAGKTVANVRYYNMVGQEMQEANGMTIVVTTYTDGTTSAVKVIK